MPRRHVRHAEFVVAQPHLVGHPSAFEALFLFGQFVVDFAVGFLRVEILPSLKLLVGHQEFRTPAPAERHHYDPRHNHCQYIL